MTPRQVGFPRRNGAENNEAIFSRTMSRRWWEFMTRSPREAIQARLGKQALPVKRQSRRLARLLQAGRPAIDPAMPTGVPGARSHVYQRHNLHRISARARPLDVPRMCPDAASNHGFRRYTAGPAPRQPAQNTPDQPNQPEPCNASPVSIPGACSNISAESGFNRGYSPLHAHRGD
jgi:hypothetical protein